MNVSFSYLPAKVARGVFWLRSSRWEWARKGFTSQIKETKPPKMETFDLSTAFLLGMQM